MKFLRSSLLFATVFSVAQLAAHATTITFGPATIPTAVPFTTYTQPGTTYTVTQGSQGQFFENIAQGNPPEGITSGSATGASFATSSIVLTDAGSVFNFTSFDLDPPTGTTSYDLVGRVGSTVVFNITGADSTSAAWSTILNPAGGVGVTSVTLIFSDGASNNLYTVDNLVASTPEPESLVLVGTALVGAAGAARRRLSL